MRSGRIGDSHGPEDQALPQQPREDSWEVMTEGDGDGGTSRSMLLPYVGSWWLFWVDRKGDGPQ